jgi:deoxyribodipyrimidine photo-lyase
MIQITELAELKPGIPRIVWLKRDLRLADHAALEAACSAGGAVLPLYIVEPDYWALPDTSRRHWHFINDCLIDLREDLARHGTPLTVRIGNVTDVLSDLRERLGHFALYSHEETGNGWTFRRDRQVAAWCRDHGVNWREFPSHGVVRRLDNRDHWSKLRDARMKAPLVSEPERIRGVAGIDPGKLPMKNDPLFGRLAIGNVQQGGRVEGLRTLDSFLKDRSRRYMQTISKPGVSARHCSRLSAHIAYGSLSVREIEHAAKARLKSLAGWDDPDAVSHRRNISSFLSRLAWRCHFVQKLEQQPQIEFTCMHPAFEGMREPHHDEALFESWKEGRTGYPLVDASMRSLHENGWINFRMRAMLVSFASYHLWLDWRVTAPHLARLFTDYEPGIHFSQFQMQSGVTGINTLRIYSPVKQSLDHDPEGKFIRRYVPELKDMATQWIHEPWRMPEPPKAYPPPIVDHEAAVRHARTELAARFRTGEFRKEAAKVASKLGSRNRPGARRPKKKPAPQLELDL